MTQRPLRAILTGGRFFEAPRWHDGTWWVSDFYRHTVYRVTPDGREIAVLEVERQPSGLGWLPDGSMVVVSMKDRRVLRYADGEVSTYAELGEHCGGKLNDLVVDRHGHVFVGDFGAALGDRRGFAPTSVKRIDPDGSVTVAAQDVHFPNGMVITPDGGTLLVGESTARRYAAFDLAPDGSLSNRRVWADLRTEGVAPDGCTLDAEGCLWVADAVGRRVVRIAPGGEILETLLPPDGLGAYACALGGEDGRTLLLSFAPNHTGSGPAGAVLMAAQVDVPHAGLP